MILEIPIMLMAFYLFATVLLAAAIMVIAAKNPVHSVLYLILTFFNAAALFILLGAELISMTLIIVYVGAVAVLFLFVVMMFDFHHANEPLPRSLKLISACLGTVLLCEMTLLFFTWQSSPLAREGLSNPVPVGRTNAHSLGDILYTKYMVLFQLSGLILLVAIVGAITLTLRDRPRSKRQVIADQINRDPAETVTLVKVASGEGVKKKS